MLATTPLACPKCKNNKKCNTHRAKARVDYQLRHGLTCRYCHKPPHGTQPLSKGRCRTCYNDREKRGRLCKGCGQATKNATCWRCTAQKRVLAQRKKRMICNFCGRPPRDYMPLNRSRCQACYKLDVYHSTKLKQATEYAPEAYIYL